MLNSVAVFCVRALGVLAQIDPVPRRVARAVASAPTPGMRLACVYRADNAAVVRPWVEQAAACGAPVGLWALDAPATELEQWTLGTGPGVRFQLLNRLLGRLPAADYTVVVDDDVRFVHGDLPTLVKVAEFLELDLAMPAHARHSFFGHVVTKTRPFIVGRRTTYVDIGPVLVVGPRWRDRLLPFPEEGMGWGVELEWYDLIEKGLRMGVIDAVPVRHLKPIGMHYSMEHERGVVQPELQRRGFDEWADLERTLARFRLSFLRRSLAARRGSG